MPLLMETCMAFTSAYHNIGIENHTEFISAWGDGALSALPVVLALMITVSMAIKPKVEKFLN
ncbi:DUF2798 domain-containing protein [Motilimonas pumila]|uniref:DUF2798 domain-containing protein n=1 Tax=Motilimonas pumila TaxID=2303987 RepID=A0A418YJK2_9GAMM|nr:DUF2798 domain-containing protein [Motilimonas pumila]RJG51167.1 DUF2798 domain-containing protein [Motilimonas pumila]